MEKMHFAHDKMILKNWYFGIDFTGRIHYQGQYYL